MQPRVERMMRNTAMMLTIAIALFVVLPPSADAQTSSCVIARELSLGASGEDVRCLQRYLNASGFPIATTGTGSKGLESTYFGTLTEAAVMRWQTSRGLTSTGIVSLGQVPSGTTPPVMGGDASEALEALRDARVALEDVRNEFDDAENDNNSTGNAEDLLNDTEEHLWNAFFAFLDGDYAQASDIAMNAQESASDASNEIEDGNNNNNNNEDTDEEMADDAVTSARNAINDARDEIDDADNNDNVDEAEDLLQDAENRLDDAEEALDDEDWDAATDWAEEAEDLAGDAVNAL